MQMAGILNYRIIIILNLFKKQYYVDVNVLVVILCGRNLLFSNYFHLYKVTNQNLPHMQQPSLIRSILFRIQCWLTSKLETVQSRNFFNSGICSKSEDVEISFWKQNDMQYRKRESLYAQQRISETGLLFDMDLNAGQILYDKQ